MASLRFADLEAKSIIASDTDLVARESGGGEIGGAEAGGYETLPAKPASRASHRIPQPPITRRAGARSATPRPDPRPARRIHGCRPVDPPSRPEARVEPVPAGHFGGRALGDRARAVGSAAGDVLGSDKGT